MTRDESGMKLWPNGGAIVLFEKGNLQLKATTQRAEEEAANGPT